MNTFPGKKALVIGSGSIGKRHTENLVYLGLDVVVFTRRNSLDGLNYKNVVYTNCLEDVSEQLFDVCVVASTTNRHLADTLWAAGFCNHFYIEKPLSNSSQGVNDVIELLSSKGAVVDAGFMLRSHPNVIAIKKFVDSGKLGHLHYSHAHVGQWLGDWRPDVDYKSSYSASVEQGGGVVFDLIHEIDLVHYLFGPVKNISADVSVSSYLEIESEGLAFINLTHSCGFKSALRLDYLRPIYQRTLEIVGSGGVLEWNYADGRVLFKSPNQADSIIDELSEGFVRNDMFIAHMQSFLDACFSGGIPRSTTADALHALNVACAAKGFEKFGV